MTIEEKKIALINWITTLEDEVVLDQIVWLKKSSFEELPHAIVKLLQVSEAEPEDSLVKHTNARSLLTKG
jgi:hypothetical protein